jgi:hypothetical protein
MFQHIYELDITYSALSIASVMFCIELFRVADKYECVSLLAELPIAFSGLLDRVLSNRVDLAHADAVDKLS